MSSLRRSFSTFGLGHLRCLALYIPFADISDITYCLWDLFFRAFKSIVFFLGSFALVGELVSLDFERLLNLFEEFSVNDFSLPSD